MRIHLRTLGQVRCAQLLTLTCSSPRSSAVRWFSWWQFGDLNASRYSGWSSSVSTLRSHIAAHGPYDGYLGFSQGAAFLALVTAIAHYQQRREAQTEGGRALKASPMEKTRLDELAEVDCRFILESPKAAAASSVDSSAAADAAFSASSSSLPSPLPRFIFISGFIPRVAHLKQFFPRPLASTAADALAPEVESKNAWPQVDDFAYDPDLPLIALPSLHVYGLSDGDVPPRECLALSRTFLNPQIEHHASGHIIPSNAEFGRKYKAFLTAAGATA